MLRGGKTRRGVLEVALPGRGAIDLPRGRKGLPGGSEVGENIQINYKMNYIQVSFQRFSQHFKSTLYWLLQVYCITQKMHFSEYLFKTFLEELAFLLLYSPVTFLKMLYFFCYVSRIVPKDFWSFSKFFQSISISHSVPFKFMHEFIHQMKEADFRPIRSW